MLRCAVLCCVAAKGDKRSARDSQYIRSILSGVNPAAPADGQVSSSNKQWHHILVFVHEQQAVRLACWSFCLSARLLLQHTSSFCYSCSLSMQSGKLCRCGTGVP